jgi:signal transduction histidine kinase
MKQAWQNFHSNNRLAHLYLAWEVFVQQVRDSLYQHIYRRILTPSTASIEARRREFNLRAVLIAVFACLLLGILGTAHYWQRTMAGSLQPLYFVVPVTSTFLFLLWLSRRGFINGAASVIITCLAVITVATMYRLGFEHPLTELLLVLILLLSSILFSSVVVLSVTASVALLLLFLAHLQEQGLFIHQPVWLKDPPVFSNAVSSAILFLAIGIFLWLANREIEHTLQRAQWTEQVLMEERDNLEQKIAERDYELRQAQLSRLLEQERLAEFGRLSAAVLHDLATPLATASLSLAEASKSPGPASLNIVRRSLERIEQYLSTARHQLQPTAVRSFSVRQETRSVIAMCQPTARQHQVQLRLVGKADTRLTGDPVKFGRLLANLIINAIEAYPAASVDTISQKRQVEIRYFQYHSQAVVAVQDFGAGIPAAIRQKIYEPFVTTKPSSQNNSGIGLTLVKRYVEQDFRGRLGLRTSRSGTCFKVYFPLRVKEFD